MFRTGNHRGDVERGSEGFAGIPWPVGSPQPQHDEHPQIGRNNRNDPSGSPEVGKESHEQHRDFDDSANELWSLYGKEAKSHDEARIKTLKDDMDGILIYAGLLSAVLTAFVVPKIQDLKSNPASASDRRVNIFWLISLVLSLSAALLATLVQQWVRAYMCIFQQSSNPLKTARIRLFLFEDAKDLPMVAEVVPGLIHASLILFFWGLGDIVLQIDRAVFVATAVPIAVCVCLYLCCVVAPIRNPRSPYRTPFSAVIWHLYRKLYNFSRGKVVQFTSMEARQEQSAMEETKGRKDRDMCAVRWLVDNINGSNETQAFVLAIPGSFNQEWGRDVWKGVVKDDQLTSTVDPQTRPHHGLPSPREATTVPNLCRYVRYLLKTFSSEGDFMEVKDRRRRMRLCVETVASLVCCTDVKLGQFGEVGEVLSELGDKERTNDQLTTKSNPSFTVRWTCLSLVAIWKMLDSDEVRELARLALGGIARFQTDYGGSDTMALTAAQEIDDYLKKSLASVVQLRLAKPWGQNRTEFNIVETLNSHEELISELERIAIEAVGVEEVDWRISLLQKTMDRVTHKLTRCLPGVFFNEMKPAESIMIGEAFDFSPIETTPLPPQLIFPGQQIRNLCAFGRRLRDIIDGLNTEMHEDTLKSLETLREIPVALRGRNNLMKRQHWRFLDLRDGGGLGFTIELFFLTLRQLFSTSLSPELEDFYTGAFKVITSDWKSKNSAGTQRILLDLLCDLVIQSRGVFSNFHYPPYIVDPLLDLVEKMVEGHSDSHPHINEIVEELKVDDPWNRMDKVLRDKALSAISPSSNTASS